MEICSKKSAGYNQKYIISKVRKAALKAKNSKTQFEIDSLIFQKPYRNIHFKKILLNLSKNNNSIKYWILVAP